LSLTTSSETKVGEGSRNTLFRTRWRVKKRKNNREERHLRRSCPNTPRKKGGEMRHGPFTFYLLPDVTGESRGKSTKVVILTLEPEAKQKRKERHETRPTLTSLPARGKRRRKSGFNISCSLGNKGKKGASSVPPTFNHPGKNYQKTGCTFSCF